MPTTVSLPIVAVHEASTWKSPKLCESILQSRAGRSATEKKFRRRWSGAASSVKGPLPRTLAPNSVGRFCYVIFMSWLRFCVHRAMGIPVCASLRLLWTRLMKHGLPAPSPNIDRCSSCLDDVLGGCCLPSF